MTETEVIDGKAFVEKLCQKIAAEVTTLTPLGTSGLAVILVGDDPASAVYVRNKGRPAIRRIIPAVMRHAPSSLAHHSWFDSTGNNRHHPIRDIPSPAGP